MGVGAHCQQRAFGRELQDLDFRPRGLGDVGHLGQRFAQLVHRLAHGFATRKVTGEAAYITPAGDYWWSGAGGTYFWVDPKTNLFVVFMMQSPKQRVVYRSVLRNMVYAAVEK